MAGREERGAKNRHPFGGSLGFEAMKRLPFLFLIFAVGASIVTFGCSDGEPDDGVVISYAIDVEPILLTNCTPCHVDTVAPTASLDLSAGLGYASLVGVVSVVEPPKLRVAGSSAESYLIQKLEGTQVVGDRMPAHLPPLYPADIQIIKDWVDAGAAP
jgi:hypothetical protein